MARQRRGARTVIPNKRRKIRTESNTSVGSPIVIPALIADFHEPLKATVSRNGTRQEREGAPGSWDTLRDLEGVFGSQYFNKHSSNNNNTSKNNKELLKLLKKLVQRKHVGVHQKQDKNIDNAVLLVKRSIYNLIRERNKPRILDAADYLQDVLICGDLNKIKTLILPLVPEHVEANFKKLRTDVELKINETHRMGYNPSYRDGIRTIFHQMLADLKSDNEKALLLVKEGFTALFTLAAYTMCLSDFLMLLTFLLKFEENCEQMSNFPEYRILPVIGPMAVMREKLSKLNMEVKERLVIPGCKPLTPVCLDKDYMYLYKPETGMLTRYCIGVEDSGTTRWWVCGENMVIPPDTTHTSIANARGSLYVLSKYKGSDSNVFGTLSRISASLEVEEHIDIKFDKVPNSDVIASPQPFEWGHRDAIHFTADGVYIYIISKDKFVCRVDVFEPQIDGGVVHVRCYNIDVESLGDFTLASVYTNGKYIFVLGGICKAQKLDASCNQVMKADWKQFSVPSTSTPAYMCAWDWEKMLFWTAQASSVALVHVLGERFLDLGQPSDSGDVSSVRSKLLTLTAELAESLTRTCENRDEYKCFKDAQDFNVIRDLLKHYFHTTFGSSDSEKNGDNETKIHNLLVVLRIRLYEASLEVPLSTQLADVLAEISALVVQIATSTSLEYRVPIHPVVGQQQHNTLHELAWCILCQYFELFFPTLAQRNSFLASVLKPEQEGDGNEDLLERIPMCAIEKLASHDDVSFFFYQMSGEKNPTIIIGAVAEIRVSGGSGGVEIKDVSGDVEITDATSVVVVEEERKSSSSPPPGKPFQFILVFVEVLEKRGLALLHSIANSYASVTENHRKEMGVIIKLLNNFHFDLVARIEDKMTNQNIGDDESAVMLAPFVDAYMFYVCAIISSACRTLEAIHILLFKNKPSQHTRYKPRMSILPAAAQAQVLKFLEISSLSLIPTLVCQIASLSLRRDMVDFRSRLLSPLSDLLKEIELVSTALPAVMLSELNFLRKTEADVDEWTIKSFRSHHDGVTLKNTPRKQTVCFPDADYILVEIDKKSDFGPTSKLSIGDYHFKGRDKFSPRCIPLFGYNLTYKFDKRHVTENIFGVKIKALPLKVATDQIPILLSAQQSVAWLTCKVVADIMQFIDHKEQDRSQYQIGNNNNNVNVLTSPLFAVGYEDDLIVNADKDDAHISSVKSKKKKKSAVRESASAISLRLMDSITSPDNVAYRLLYHLSGGKGLTTPTDEAEAVVFVALLHHSGLIGDALKIADTLPPVAKQSDEESYVDVNSLISAQIRFMWQNAAKIRTWMMQQRQEMQNKNPHLDGDFIHRNACSNVKERAQFLLHCKVKTTVVKNPKKGKGKKAVSIPPSKKTGITMLPRSVTSVNMLADVMMSDDTAPRNLKRLRHSTDAEADKQKYSPKKLKRADTMYSGTPTQLSSSGSFITGDKAPHNLTMSPSHSFSGTIFALKNWKTQMNSIMEVDEQAPEQTQAVEPSFQELTREHSHTCNAVLSFIKAVVDLKDVRNQIVANRQNCLARKTGFAVLADLLGFATFSSVRQIILSWIPRATIRRGILHYTDGIAGCGEQLTTDLRNAASSLFSTLVNILKNPTSDHNLKLAGMQALGRKFNVHDTELLVKTDLLNVLKTMMDTQGGNQSDIRKSIELSTYAWRLFELIVLSLAAEDPKDLNQDVQAQIMDIILLQISANMPKMTSDEKTMNKEEKKFVKVLALLETAIIAWIPSQVEFRSDLQEKANKTLQDSLRQYISVSRIRKQIMSSFRKILVLDIYCDGVYFSQLLPYFFGVVGQSQFIGFNNKGLEFVHITAAHDIVMLLRYLALYSQKYKQMLSEIVENCVSDIPRIFSATSLKKKSHTKGWADNTRIWAAAAALSILGGFSTPVQCGSQVSVSVPHTFRNNCSVRQQYTAITLCDPSTTNQVVVKFDEESSNTFDLSEIKVEEEVQAHATLLDISNNVVDVYVYLLFSNPEVEHASSGDFAEILFLRSQFSTLAAKGLSCLWKNPVFAAVLTSKENMKMLAEKSIEPYPKLPTQMEDVIISESFLFSLYKRAKVPSVDYGYKLTELAAYSTCCFVDESITCWDVAKSENTKFDDQKLGAVKDNAEVSRMVLATCHTPFPYFYYEITIDSSAVIDKIAFGLIDIKEDDNSVLYVTDYKRGETIGWGFYYIKGVLNVFLTRGGVQEPAKEAPSIAPATITPHILLSANGNVKITSNFGSHPFTFNFFGFYVENVETAVKPPRISRVELSKDFVYKTEKQILEISTNRQETEKTDTRVAGFYTIDNSLFCDVQAGQVLFTSDDEPETAGAVREDADISATPCILKAISANKKGVLLEYEDYSRPGRKYVKWQKNNKHDVLYEFPRQFEMSSYGNDLDSKQLLTSLCDVHKALTTFYCNQVLYTMLSQNLRSFDLSALLNAQGWISLLKIFTATHVVFPSYLTSTNTAALKSNARPYPDYQQEHVLSVLHTLLRSLAQDGLFSDGGDSDGVNFSSLLAKECLAHLVFIGDLPGWAQYSCELGVAGTQKHTIYFPAADRLLFAVDSNQPPLDINVLDAVYSLQQQMLLVDFPIVDFSLRSSDARKEVPVRVLPLGVPLNVSHALTHPNFTFSWWVTNECLNIIHAASRPSASTASTSSELRRAFVSPEFVTRVCEYAKEACCLYRVDWLSSLFQHNDEFLLSIRNTYKDTFSPNSKLNFEKETYARLIKGIIPEKDNRLGLMIEALEIFGGKKPLAADSTVLRDLMQSFQHERSDFPWYLSSSKEVQSAVLPFVSKIIVRTAAFTGTENLCVAASIEALPTTEKNLKEYVVLGNSVFGFADVPKKVKLEVECEYDVTALNASFAKWTPELDHQLHKLTDARRSKKTPDSVIAENLSTPNNIITTDDVKLRQHVYTLFYERVSNSKFTLLDSVYLKDSVTSTFIANKHLIDADLHQHLFDAFVSDFPQHNNSEANINRKRALIAKTVIDTVFMQALTQLEGFCCDGKLFDVAFVGEGAEDGGGPFRDALSQICEEMHKPPLSMFIPSPNKTSNIGQNRDKYILNPALTGPADIHRFKLLGKLIGYALRNNDVLELNLPSLFWKHLVCAASTIDRSDLEAMDKLCCQNLDAITNIDKEGVTDDTFHDVIDFSFTTQRSDGKEVDLLPNGSHIPVTFKNRVEYADLVLKQRLTESEAQMRAVMRGLSKVYPLQVISLFHWRDLEVAVCGVDDVDVQALKDIVDIDYSLQNVPVIDYFWQCLYDFTPAERCAFLRFVWGRNRLPSKDTTSERFKIDAHHDPDALPCAHTCYFTLDLPQYDSYEVLKQKLLLAIYNCPTIETDFEAAE